MNDLNSLRNRINEIDDKITELLLERFAVVKNVAEYKKARNLEIFQKDREAEVLKNIAGKTKNQKYKEYILEIYETILKTSKSSQI